MLEKNKLIKSILLLSATTVLSFSCGAPTKKASEVGHIFEESETLQDKTNAACNTLSGRSESPAASDLTFKLNCNEAGLRAMNLREIDAFYFNGLDGNPPKDQKIFRKTTRTQVWLNKSLLGIASVLGKKLASGQELDLGKLDIGSSPASGGLDVSKLIKLDIEVTKKPAIDTKDFSFSMALSIKASGIVKMEHDIVIAGRLIRENNTLLVTIKTTKDQEFENSLLKNFSGAIMIIPYAGDIYLDVVLDMNIHNFGFTGAIDSQLNPLLGSGLKKGIDGILN